MSGFDSIRAHLALAPSAWAQRISRAKRTVSGVRLDQPGDVATVLRVLYLLFNEGYSGDVDLASKAIRLTRQLAAGIDHEEVAGLLALRPPGPHPTFPSATTSPAKPPDSTPICPVEQRAEGTMIRRPPTRASRPTSRPRHGQRLPRAPSRARTST
jgi:hypothetical protein